MTAHENGMNPQILVELVTTQMPFGKYSGRLLCDLPEHYVVWYHQKGFPKGKLGMQLHTLYEIQLNGLDFILKKIKSDHYSTNNYSRR